MGSQRVVTHPPRSTLYHPGARGRDPKCAMPGMTGNCAPFCHAAMLTCVPGAEGITGGRCVCRQLTQPGDQWRTKSQLSLELWDSPCVPVAFCFCCDCGRYCWAFCSIVMSSCMLVPPGKGSAAVDCVYNVLIK